MNRLLPLLGAASPAAAPPKTLAERIAGGESFATVDVVIVGSGAGGGAAARTLARKGLSVLVVEEGRKLDERDFRGKDMLWALKNLYRDGGSQAFEGDVVAPLPSGRVVGGGTVVNSAICFRGPDARLQQWQEQSGVPWLNPQVFAPLYDDVERTIVVTETTPENARQNNLVFLRGAAKLGLDHGFIRRNAPGCRGCGVCQMGCPSGGKWSVDKNFLAEATQLGVSILSSARCVRLNMNGSKCTGVVLQMLDDTGQPGRTVSVTARHTILAAGAIGTPLILLNNKVGTASGHVGRHLAMHPSFLSLAYFAEEVRAWSGVPQGAYAHVADVPDALLETFNVSADMYYVLTCSAASPERMKRANHLASSGAMLRDQSVGSVAVRSDWRADIKYTLADADRKNAIAALRWLTRLYFAAGATDVLVGRRGVDFVSNEADALAALTDDMTNQDFLQMYASHPQGTCRLSARPQDGVVAPDGRVHHTDGLFVMDGSLFPSALGVNPQMTIMSMAIHLAGALT